MTDYGRPGDQPIAAGTTGWATETLKEYTDARFEGLKELVITLINSVKELSAALRTADQRYDDAIRRADQLALVNALASAEKAVTASHAAAEKSSEKTELALKEYKTGANEWRDTVQDLVTRMPARTEVEKEFAAVNDKMKIISDQLLVMAAAKTGGKDLWGWIVGVIGLASLAYGILTK